MPVKTDPLLKHLCKDKKLAGVIKKVGIIGLRHDKDLYLLLLKAIVGQQLSMKAADTIWKRFLALFKDSYPNAKKLLKISDEKLRSAGLSYQKAGYLKNIATFSIEKTLDYSKLSDCEDEELITYLTEIKGVGRWTVEMILMFSLNRHDVFPKDDLGIRNGMIMLYDIKAVNKKDLFKEMDLIADKWRPYRTLACRYIWRYKDMARLK